MDILHAGKIHRNYLLLDESFVWHHLDGKEAGCSGSSLSDALQAAKRKWAKDFFALLHCGFRYTLPIRDETGINATFKQMVLSYSSQNGRYFDEEVGHLCFVDFASEEALELWRKIKLAPIRS